MFILTLKKLGLKETRIAQDSNFCCWSFGRIEDTIICFEDGSLNLANFQFKPTNTQLLLIHIELNLNLQA